MDGEPPQLPELNSRVADCTGSTLPAELFPSSGGGDTEKLPGHAGPHIEGDGDARSGIPVGALEPHGERGHEPRSRVATAPLASCGLDDVLLQLGLTGTPLAANSGFGDAWVVLGGMALSIDTSCRMGAQEDERTWNVNHGQICLLLLFGLQPNDLCTMINRIAYAYEVKENSGDQAQEDSFDGKGIFYINESALGQITHAVENNEVILPSHIKDLVFLGGTNPDEAMVAVDLRQAGVDFDDVEDMILSLGPLGAATAFIAGRAHILEAEEQEQTGLARPILFREWQSILESPSSEHTVRKRKREEAAESEI